MTFLRWSAWHWKIWHRTSKRKTAVTLSRNFVRWSIGNLASRKNYPYSWKQLSKSTWQRNQWRKKITCSTGSQRAWQIWVEIWGRWGANRRVKSVQFRFRAKRWSVIHGESKVCLISFPIPIRSHPFERIAHDVVSSGSRVRNYNSINLHDKMLHLRTLVSLSIVLEAITAFQDTANFHILCSFSLSCAIIHTYLCKKKFTCRN